MARTAEPYTLYAKLFPKLALPFMVYREYNTATPNDKVVIYGLYDKLLAKNTSVIDPDTDIDDLDMDNTNPIAYENSQEIDVIVDDKMYQMGCHWFLLPMKHKTTKNGRVKLQTDQQRSYLDQMFPIIIFENGQTRAELSTSSFLKDEIKYLQNNLIVFIQADSVPYSIRAKIFNPNREALKKKYEKAIRKAMQDAMCNDPVLKHYNDLFAQEKLGKPVEDSVSMCDESLAEFLNGTIGIDINKNGTIETNNKTTTIICGGDEESDDDCEGDGKRKRGHSDEPHINKKLPKMETSDPPTIFDFATKSFPIEVRPGKSSTLRAITNATKDYMNSMHPENSRIKVSVNATTSIIINDDSDDIGDNSNE